MRRNERPCSSSGCSSILAVGERVLRRVEEESPKLTVGVLGFEGRGGRWDRERGDVEGSELESIERRVRFWRRSFDEVEERGVVVRERQGRKLEEEEEGVGKEEGGGTEERRTYSFTAPSLDPSMVKSYDRSHEVLLPIDLVAT